MLPHPLANFEIQKYYQNDAQLSSKNEPKFNGVYLRKNLPKIKDGAYVINPDEYKSIGTRWVAFYVNSDNVTYFDSFGVEVFQKKLEISLKTKILHRIFIEYKHIIQ